MLLIPIRPHALALGVGPCILRPSPYVLHTLTAALQEAGAEKILFGYDQVVEAYGPQPKELIIVEGEMDVLALYEAGIKNVVSVPDGAVCGPHPHSGFWAGSADLCMRV